MRRVFLCGAAVAMTLAVGCSAPSADEARAIAKERGYTVVDDTHVPDGPRTGIGVEMPGECSATLFAYEIPARRPGDPTVAATIKVYNPDGVEIYVGGGSTYEEVLKVSQVKKTCKDD